MKLFTVGPVEMYPETLEITAKQLPYFRTEEFSETMFENSRLLKESIHAPQDAKTVFLTASGTGAMEAAVINAFVSTDRLLIINGGGFGKRFAEICDVHNIPYDELRLEFGEELTYDKLYAFDGRQYGGLLVNMHETSTGQLYNMDLLSEYCRKYDLYFIVDAISAYGAEEIDFAAYGIDALIVSSQKALALSPGLSMVILSDRLYRDRVLTIESGSYYLDFKSHIKNMERGQTPFTPAVGILLELQERLRFITECGMEQIVRERRKLAERFRGEVIEAGFQIPKYPLSSALTPVILKPDAKVIYVRLKEEYGLVVTPSGGELGDTLIRIGHLGNLCWQDYENLLTAMRTIKSAL